VGLVAVGVSLMVSGLSGIWILISGVFIAMSARIEVATATIGERIGPAKINQYTWFGIAEVGPDMDVDSMLWQRSRLGGAGAVAIRGETGTIDGIVLEDQMWNVPADNRAWTMLTSLILLDGTFVSGGVSFLGLQVGSQFTQPAEQIQAGDLLGFLHYGTDLIGQDLLPLIDGPFTGLPSGVYTAWVQDTGGGAAGYGFDFQLTAAPVPLPGAVWLLASGALGLGALRRRRAAAAA
jgi:hypothetical protein